MNDVFNYEKVAVVGAFDRHNYGDLLFPVILEEMLRINGFDGDVEYYSTSVSDMSRYGAKDTVGLGQLFRKSKTSCELIVIAGGEVLPATWPLIISYLVSPLAAKFINRGSKFLGSSVSAYVISRLLGVKSLLPFVFAPEDFSRKVKIAYNAVGGSHVKDENNFVRDTLVSKLKNADYISVRDQETKDFLAKGGVENVELSPDCAILLSHIFPYESLGSRAGPCAHNVVNKFSRGYVCFQSAASYVKGNEAVIKFQVLDLIKRTGFGVVFFAIGRATGHSDHEIFDFIKNDYDLNKSPDVVVCDCDSIFDLMWVISNSKVYAGTSLHGAITAASYGVPIIGLCSNKVNKLQAFLKTWVGHDEYKLTDYDGLSSAAAAFVSHDHKKNSERVEYAQNLAIFNFKKIFDL